MLWFLVAITGKNWSEASSYWCQIRVITPANIDKLNEVWNPNGQARLACLVESTTARLNEDDEEAVIWGLQRINPVSKVAAAEIDKLLPCVRRDAHRFDFKKG